MTNIERLRQYLMKASFSSAGDKFSAMECLSEIDVSWLEIQSARTAAEPGGWCATRTSEQTKSASCAMAVARCIT